MKIQEFEMLIPDKGIRDYITTGIDEDNLLGESIDFVPMYQNIFNLAFTYAFSCYLDLKNNSRNGQAVNLDATNKNGNANSQRVLRTMQHIYSRYPISSELMQFVLADIYYDFIQGDRSCLSKFFPNCVASSDYWYDKGIGLNDYFSFINENIESSRVDFDPVGEPFTLNTASQHLRMLVGFFPFLSKTSLEYDEKAGWYVFKIQNLGKGSYFRNGIIDTFGLVQKFGKRNSYFCFLSKIDEQILRYETPCMDTFIVCPMVGVSGEGSFVDNGAALKKPFNIPTDHETIMSYFSHNEPSVSAKKNDLGVSMDQLFNINYKYMKNLALAIADVIGKQHYKVAEERLKDVFKHKYPHAFDSYSQDNKNLDSVIIILLIEAGPTAVLREIFDAINDQGDDEILKSVKRRFGNMLSGLIMDIDDSEAFLESAKQLLGTRYIENASSKELEDYNNELIAKAKTQIVLSAISKAEQDNLADIKADCFHTDNIQQHIILLKASSSDSPENQCKLVENALSDTFRRLICFYRGVFKYGGERIKFDNASRRKLLTRAEIEKYQKSAEAAFVEEAKKAAEELNDISSIDLIKRFVELCDECYNSEASVKQDRKIESRQLYAVLGKNELMNKAKFEKIIDLKTATAINTANIGWWLERTIELLQFLSIRITADKTSQPGYHAIAPMVASYNNHIDSKDGYDTATFALIFDANELNGKQTEINMLSEFNYELRLRYYCLPNVVRSNQKWWIDPFVIKCSDFDAIFLER